MYFSTKRSGFQQCKLLCFCAHWNCAAKQKKGEKLDRPPGWFFQTLGRKMTYLLVDTPRPAVEHCSSTYNCRMQLSQARSTASCKICILEIPAVFFKSSHQKEKITIKNSNSFPSWQRLGPRQKTIHKTPRFWLPQLFATEALPHFGPETAHKHGNPWRCNPRLGGKLRWLGFPRGRRHGRHTQEWRFWNFWRQKKSTKCPVIRDSSLKHTPEKEF